MGLDMYLTGRKFLWDEEQQTVAKALEVEARDFSVKSVTVEVGYWRKSNQIHNWFVKNVQNGTDDCGTYCVNRDKLKELLDACKHVVADPKLGNKLLPTASGFFFGSTSYDTYYLEDVTSTVAILEKALTLPNSWDFEYYASW